MDEKPINIVVIDDDEVDCELITRLLKKTNLMYNLYVFHEGEKAIDFLKLENHVNNPGKKYLVMLDINMPSMNGFQVIERLNQLESTDFFKAYIFTTSNNFQDRQRAEQMGITDYFLKQDLTCNNNLLLNMIQDFTIHMKAKGQVDS